jgi:hypothetical protein
MSQFEEQPEYLTAQPAFFRIPKALFTDESYSELTVSAKMLYGLLLDRLNISRINRLADREGRAFVYFTLDEVMSRLHCARAKADGIMDELRAAGLIETKRRGQGKANVIYVNDLDFS